MASSSSTPTVPPEISSIHYFAQNPTIEQCEAATAGMGEFRKTEKADYVLFNYDYCHRGTFPDPYMAKTVEEANLLKVRRECRGIIFDKATGAIKARRYHKFFNLNEKDETHEDLIDVSRPHVILNKMDGCLVSPFMVEGKIKWGSKMGVTELSDEMEQQFLPKMKNIKYNEFSLHWINEGYTPLFEWCSFRQRIVVEYAEDMLILTAIRHNYNGLYVKYAEMSASAAQYGVPVTQPITVSFGDQYKTLGELMKHVKETTDLEGFVLCFENGEFYKLKTEWYFERSKKIAGAFTGEEKDLWDLILNRKIDDLGGALGPDRTARLEAAGNELWEALKRSSERISMWIAQQKLLTPERKGFAAALVQHKIGEWTKLYFNIFDGKDALEEIVAVCLEYRKNRNRLDRVRTAFAENMKIAL